VKEGGITQRPGSFGFYFIITEIMGSSKCIKMAQYSSETGKEIHTYFIKGQIG
jgi:hypothetical protein